MADTFSLNQIGQIAVYVKDLDRAVAFYKDMLGMPFLFQAPPGLAFFNCSGIRLMLNRPETGTDEAALGTSIIYYKVPNIDAAYAALRSKGASFMDQPHKIADMPDHELWMVFLRDSEGNLLGLMAEKPLP